MTRRCGPCTVCCKTLGIHEIGKAAGEKCWRLGYRGCSIYATRPRSCRGFECLWLQGRFLASERPDLAGLLVTLVPSTVRFTRETGLALFNAFRVAPGDLPAVGQGLFDKLARENIVTLGGRIFGPPGKLPRAVDWIDAEAKREAGEHAKA